MITDKQYQDLVKVIENRSDTIQNKEIKPYEKKKYPTHFLEFKESPIGAVRVFHKGHDGHFYLVKGTNDAYEIIRYDNVVEPSQGETILSWDTANWGTPIQIIATSEDLTVFSNTENTARIYHIEENVPELVYESNDANQSFFTRQFGVKSYHSGISGAATIILAAVYGRGLDNRDLLLSLDGGKSFDIVKQTQLNNTNQNSHWHDVAIDVYSGLLWASEGDSPDNRGVYFSDDLGESWTTLSNRTQATAILPFADRVVFGRDDGLPGLSYFEKPLTLEDYNKLDNDSIKILREFKPNTEGYALYGITPVTEGQEGYLMYSRYPGETPNIIMGTGDGGISFHGLFMGFGPMSGGASDLTAIWAMDDDYIYATNTTQDILVYAKRPKWG